MGSRGTITRFFGALACAYLVVLTAALGGLAMDRHPGSMTDPLGVICLNSGEGDQDGAGDQGAQGLGCCTFGCLSAAIAPASTPDALAFRYDPRPTPLRAARERDKNPRDEVLRALKRPRGPPAIG